MIKKFFVFFIFVFGFVHAEMQNHYVLGTNGLNSAVKLPGFNLAGIYTHYKANRLKNSKGKNVEVNGERVKGHVTYDYVQLIGAYYSDRCFLGGKYGFMVDIPFVNNSLDFAVLNQSLNLGKSPLRLSDIYLEPINLRWQIKGLSIFTAAGVFFPSGKFRYLSAHNSGLGNYGIMGTLAATYFFDCEKTWSLSFYATYEKHFKKRRVDFYPGDNLCVDWGFGKSFGLINVGIVGYIERQTTNDHGSAVPNFAKRNRDRVYAVGPEIDFLVPQLNGIIIFRYEREFKAALRTQGESYITEAALVF